MFRTHLNLHYCKSVIISLVFIGKSKRLKRVVAFVAMLLIVYNVNTHAQNINSATNGLSKANDTTVSMGGTLTQNTDIDLGWTFKMGYKKGSLSYLSILNNGNVGLGVANPLAQFHTSGSIRFDLFKNNATSDSLITTDADGNLIFKSIANYLNVSNGLYYEDGAIKLGGVLDESTTLDGQGTGDIKLVNLNIFRGEGIDSRIKGTFRLQLFGGGSSLINLQEGIEGFGGDGGVRFQTGLYKSAELVAQIGSSPDNSPILLDLSLDSMGMLLTTLSSYDINRELYKFGPDGRAYFRRYSSYNTGVDWPKFQDGPTSKALYLDENSGMLMYGPVATIGGNTLNFVNGLTRTDSTVKLGGILTDEVTTIDGQSTNHLIFSNLNSFSVHSSEAGMTGTSSLGLVGGSASFVLGGGIGAFSGDDAGMRFKAGINQKAALAAQIDYSYGMTPVDNELWLDTAGVRLMKTSPFLGDTELFKFGLDGRAWFRGYSTQTNSYPFLDPPTGKALYIDSATGAVMYGDILAGSDLEFGGGLVKEGNRVKLGGTLDDYTQLLVTGDPTFSIYTEDDRSMGFLREEEGREWLVQLKNKNSELGLQRNALGLNVRDFESGNWSTISMQPHQNRFGLSLNGGYRESYIAQYEDGGIYLGTQESNMESQQMVQNIVRLDAGGFAFNVFNSDRFSIKTDGSLQLFNYLNNPAEDQVLTTDIEGNLKFKSLAESIPTYSFTEGITRIGDSVVLGGDLFSNGLLTFRDPNGAAPGYSRMSWNNGTLNLFGMDTTTSQVHLLSMNQGSIQLANSLGGIMILEGESSRYGFYKGSAGSSSLEISSGHIKLGHEPSEGSNLMSKLDLYKDIGGAILQSSTFLSLRTGYTTNLNMDQANFDILAPNYDFSGTHNLRVGVNGLTFGVSQPTESGQTFTERYLAIGNDGKFFLEKYRNNEAEDSVLTTDVDGNLKFKAISGLGGGGTDSAWAYDSANIYNRNTGNVGIGTLHPTAKFHTLGSVRFESFKNNLQGDSVLTTDAEGNLKFVYMPYGSGGGGGTGYIFGNGVTQANGNVRLGGLLSDSVKIDLAGYPFQYNNGINKVIDISADGNVGIGTVASGYKFTVKGMSVGHAFDSVGWGDRFWLNGYGNTDGVWMSRYNAGPDASELRVSISDDGGTGDKFHIGHFMWDNPTVWQSTFMVQANGTAGVGTGDITGEMSIGKGHGNKLTVGNSNWAKTGILTTGWDSNNNDYTDLLVPGAETNTALIRINKAGNVGIGTLNPDALYKLSVNGKIRAKGLRVQSSGWADFVFEPDYKLMSLPELEKFIRNKKHLPGIATAAEVMKEGNDVGQTQVQLLQKVEELTLYIIELNKQVKELEDKNKKLESQQSQITQLQQQLDELRKLILNK